MRDKIGRNDACPCGSGKKYKHCHGREDTNVVALPDDASLAVERALRWLDERRRKAFKARIQALGDSVLVGPQGEPPRDLGDRFLDQLDINVVEWVLAEGSIDVKGENVRVVDDLLGPNGPAFSPAQRQYIEQLRAQPLRLYTVTDVQPGEGLTLCDALDEAAVPVFVTEDHGSRTIEPGMLIGTRILAVGQQHEMSGSIYPFALGVAPEVTGAVRAIDHEGADEGDAATRREHVSLEIMRRWARQFTEPVRLPKIMDAASGEPMLLITDHYRVVDPTALAGALAACGDVSGDAQHGWRREWIGKDELVRSSVVVNPGKQPDRIEVFYRTSKQADDGRVWFDGIVGESVAHLTREITDPQGAFARRGIGDLSTPRAARAGTASTDALPPDVLAQAIEQTLGKYYANWCDEPIPALGGKTPRETIATPAGLERVKGLLRSYEDGERRQSTDQRRPAFSYQFLWDGLGIER
jgi:SEC-C motif/Protein of unknown function (DUF2384)